ADPARAGLHEKERYERLRRLLPGLRQVITESASRESGRWQRERYRPLKHLFHQWKAPDGDEARVESRSETRRGPKRDEE
ncbi:MAG: hypothetical protein MI919_29945, partial [Holophagales bacterium]|nr:hypothetical protein [Holophagales bacterium]